MGKAVAPKTKNDVGSLNDRQRAFAREYILDHHGHHAAIRAGYSTKAAYNAATTLLANPLVQDEIRRLMHNLEKKTGVTAARLIEEAWGIATADVNDLVEYRRNCCRHCYGIGFGRQRTVAEFNKAKSDYLVKRAKAILKGINADDYEEFDEEGGIGYDARKAPNPDCMECFGDGIGSTHFKDTRNLTPAARALYAGVKQTKDGHQMLLIDKLGAMEKLFKHMGLYKVDNEQKSSDFQTFMAAIVARGGGKLPIKDQ
jgi:phage terminase small subunit